VNVSNVLRMMCWMEMPQCIAYDVLDGKVGRCVNIVPDGGFMVCSNPMCQRINSKMIESD
jgi:hypothetical protein